MAARVVLDDLDTALAVIAQLKLDRENLRVRAEEAEHLLLSTRNDVSALQQLLHEAEQNTATMRNQYEARIKHWHDEAQKELQDFEQLREQVRMKSCV